MDKETRTTTIQAAELRVKRDDDGAPTGIAGYAAVFDTPTELMPGLREQIAKGAFTSALARPDDVRALFNHDSNYVLGRTKADTLRLEEDAKGLRFDVDMPDTQIARDVATSIERGDVDGSSFSFRVTSEKWDDEDAGELRTLLDLELFDVGPVTFPAYVDTSVATRSQETYRAGKGTPRRNRCRQRAAESK